MKTIGLLGGMSWESTSLYYQLINREVGARLGGLHSAKIVLSSVDFHEVEDLQSRGAWSQAAELLTEQARAVESGGAELLLLCTNTMHKVSSRIERAIGIPFLHIGDAVADEVARAGVQRVGLLGTRFTMEQTFYRERLSERRDLEVLVPGSKDRQYVDRVIYEELCRGQTRQASRQEYGRIVAELETRGCRGVVLGCTEIGMLLAPEDSSLPLFDSASIHARHAVEYALGHV